MNKATIQSFAAGIIFTTACVAGYTYWLETDIKQNVTISEAEEMLKKKGFQVIKSNAANSSPDQALEKVKKETETKPETVNETKESQTSPLISYSLNIKSGMTSDNIASILEKENIIDEAASFVTFMDQKKLDQRIQLGEYIVTSTMSLSQIANTITK